MIFLRLLWRLMAAVGTVGNVQDFFGVISPAATTGDPLIPDPYAKRCNSYSRDNALHIYSSRTGHLHSIRYKERLNLHDHNVYNFNCREDLLRSDRRK